MNTGYIRIESFHHRKGEPIPQLDFSGVRNYFSFLGESPRPDHELFMTQDGLEKQIGSAPGDELQVFYYTVGRNHE